MGVSFRWRCFGDGLTSPGRAQDYIRHYELIGQYPELRARDAVKMQQFAVKLSEVLLRRGSGEAIAVLAGQIAIACYQTAKLLGNNPRTLVGETEAALSQVLTLGAARSRPARRARS